MKKPPKRVRKTPPYRPRRVLAKRIPARLFRLRCDPKLPGVIELRISRKRWQMLEEILSWTHGVDPETEGQLTSYHSVRINRGQPRQLRQFVVGRMFLNAQSLNNRPSEIITHESTHAGLAWGRLRKANLNHMPGEEVVCHASGRIAKQVVHACYSMGIF